MQHFGCIQNDFIESPTETDLPIHIRSEMAIKPKSKRTKGLMKKCRSFPKVVTTSKGDVFESVTRQGWELTKVAGLATRGEEMEILNRIAKNLACKR